MSIVRKGAEGNVGFEEGTSSARKQTPLVLVLLVQLVALRPTAASQVCSLPLLQVSVVSPSCLDSVCSFFPKLFFNLGLSF